MSPLVGKSRPGYFEEKKIMFCVILLTPFAFYDRQTGRAPWDAAVINADFLQDGTYLELAYRVLNDRASYLSKIADISILEYFAHTHEGLRRLDENDPKKNPHSYLLVPVKGSFDDNADIVGFYMSVVPWNIYFAGILPDGSDGLEVVISDSCGSTFTYLLRGPVATVKGEGDLHDTSYNSLRRSSVLTKNIQTAEDGLCEYVMDIYATEELENNYTDSRDPLIYAIVVAMIFVFTTMVFLVYDWAVQRRQWMIIRAARKTQAIVSSLFPKNVQDRIMKDVDEEVNREANGPLITRGNRTKDQLQNFLKGKEADGEDDENKRSKPIADLFPEATIIFADIVGFTAWSSTREPTQVFQLLETIYAVFDEIANRRRVFKVETVGDCKCPSTSF